MNDEEIKDVSSDDSYRDRDEEWRRGRGRERKREVKEDVGGDVEEDGDGGWRNGGGFKKFSSPKELREPTTPPVRTARRRERTVEEGARRKEINVSGVF
jgi:hypothetical protein